MSGPAYHRHFDFRDAMALSGSELAVAKVHLTRELALKRFGVGLLGQGRNMTGRRVVATDTHRGI